MANRFMDETALKEIALHIFRAELGAGFKLENARDLLEKTTRRIVAAGLDEPQARTFASQLIGEMIDDEVFDIRPSDKPSTPPPRS